MYLAPCPAHRDCDGSKVQVLSVDAYGAGKGIAYARVQLPDGTSAHVFNTHTHANWVHSTAPDALYPEVRIPTDSFAPYRTAHIVDAISFMRRTVEAASAAEELVIAGGGWCGAWQGWISRGQGFPCARLLVWQLRFCCTEQGGVRHGKGCHG